VSPAAKSTIRREFGPTHRQSPSKRLPAILV
jgi:hypothetical protein